MAVASAGPYANNLHLAPDRQPHQHLITQFLQAGCSSWRPANSIKALKTLIMAYVSHAHLLSQGCLQCTTWSLEQRPVSSVTRLILCRNNTAKHLLNSLSNRHRQARVRCQCTEIHPHQRASSAVSHKPLLQQSKSTSLKTIKMCSHPDSTCMSAQAFTHPEPWP